MLAAGALVASLLAVSASPVGAAQEKADHKATTSACVGDALDDQAYTDVSDGHAFRDAINCIAYYGITDGTGDGSTFSPNDDVTRAQMAVFLARAAGVAGVDLGDAKDQGFDDIGDLWQEAQDAINQLAGKGILPKGGSYRPDDAMTRAEMATALIGLLDAAEAVDINNDGTIDLGDDGADDDADDYFADARALSPRTVDRAAAALFELGVTNGTGRAAVVDAKKTPLDTNFDPNGTVDRGQMAAFITRALAHTSARPEGVTAQAVGNKVLVSVRDGEYSPVSNAWVEVFYVETADEDGALNADGECGRLVLGTGDGLHPCEIDGSDLLTNGNGDAETQAIDVPDDGVVAWAWTGDIGDEVDDDTAHYRLAMSKAAAEPEVSTQAHISTSLKGSKGKIGGSVTVTLQLQNTAGDNVTGGAQDPAEPAKWLAIVSTYRGPAVTAAGTEVLRNTVRLTSDSDGKATFLLASPPDPNADAKGDQWTVGYSVVADPTDCDANADSTDFAATTPCSAPVTGAGTYPTVAPAAVITDGDADTNTGAQDSSGSVTFSDESGVPTTISIETSSYVAVADRTGRTAINRAKVTLTDTFGDPVRNAKVTLTSDLGRTDDTTDTDGASSLAATTGGTPRTFTTGSDGSYTFGYTYSSTTGDVETITAVHDRTPDDNTDNAADNANYVNKTAAVNWAQAGGAAQTATPVVAGDVDANQIVVVVSDVPMIVTYDDEDRFNTSASGTTDSTPASMAEFEKMLAKFLGTEATTDENVIWSNYSSRPRNTSVFTLDDAS